MASDEYDYHLHFKSCFRAAEKGKRRPTVIALDWHPNPSALGFDAVIAFSTNRELRVVGCAAEKWEMLHEREPSEGREIHAIKWNPSNRQLAFSSGNLNGSKNVIICLEYLTDGFQKIRTEKVAGRVTSLTWERTGKFLVATLVSDVSTMVIMKQMSESRYNIKAFPCPHDTDFTAEVHPTEQMILTATSGSNEISVWIEDKSLFDWKVTFTIPCILGITTMCFSKDESKVAIFKWSEVFSYIVSSDGEPCIPRLENVDFVDNDGIAPRGSLKQHCRSSISLDWSRNNHLLTGSKMGTMCMHQLSADGSIFYVAYFRWSDVHSCNQKGPVTCVAWNRVDGVVILWQLLGRSIPLQYNKSYAVEKHYFLPERLTLMDLDVENVQDVLSVSSVSTSMSTTFNSDFEDDYQDGPSDIVDPIDTQLLQQISSQQSQAVKSMKVLVATLSKVKELVKGSNEAIDKILRVVKQLAQSDEIEALNGVVAEIPTAISQLEVKVIEIEEAHKKEVKDLKNELIVGYKKLSDEVLSALEQVKQSYEQLQISILSRHNQLEESILTMHSNLQESTRLMLSQVEERILSKQQEQHDKIMQQEATSDKSTALRLRQLEDKMISTEQSLQKIILQKHNQLVEGNEENNRQTNQKLDRLTEMCDKICKSVSE